jgi:hypothetical protein
MARTATKERKKARLQVDLKVAQNAGSLVSKEARQRERWRNQPDNPMPEHIGKALMGRPPDYRPVYCEMVREMAVRGHSIGAFAGEIGASRSCINTWIRIFPDFAEACARAGAGRLWFWETKLIHVANTGGSGSQGQVAIFGVVNAARTCEHLTAPDWVNKQEIEHSGSATLANVVERMMDKLDQIAKAQAGPRTIIIEGEQAPADEADSLW